MNDDIFTVKRGRLICIWLVLVDIILGGTATFFPFFYIELIHPNATSTPVDYVVRTGILWCVFAVFQAIAATRKEPISQKKWFFAVGIIRLMEIPADIVYGILAIGATIMTRLMIWSAPVVNFICGTYLYKLSLKLEKENLLVNNT